MSPVSVFLQQLLAYGPEGIGVSDDELLRRFVSSGDQDALAALVRRHAEMVWGVCDRLLRAHHDAEDAFQATFLVLVRKAAHVPRGAVAGWLYGVARQTAIRSRATAAKQRLRETQAPAVLEAIDPARNDFDRNAALDEEVGRLPEHYRTVLVLCDLEGMTRKEAARQLDVPEGSVASRLARARELLAKRLTRRGVTVSAAMVPATLSQHIASAGFPHSVVSSTISVASVFFTRHTATSGISAAASTLAEGVLRTMFLAKLKMACVMVLAMALIGGTAAWFIPSSGSLLYAQTPAIQSEVEKKLDLQRLQGIWKPVAVVSVDERADDKNLLNRTRLIIKGDTFRVVTTFDLEMPVKEKLESVVMEGRLDIDPEKTPKSMDWRVQTPKLNAPILKVYEVDGDKLKIVTGSATERPASARQFDENTKAIFYQREAANASK